MSVTEIPILVKSLQWLDGVFVDPFQILENNISNLVDCLFAMLRFVVQVQKFSNMLPAAEVCRNFEFLKEEKGF